MCDASGVPLEFDLSKRNRRIAGTSTALLAGVIAMASTNDARAAELNTGNTAWMLTSTALVLLMTIPGLALFYGGLVQARNVLSVLVHCFTITCLVSILWLVVGYSLVFGEGGTMQAWIGGLDKVLFSGIGVDALTNDIPESVFFMFQMTFAIITPALIVGAYPERIRFSAVLWFTAAWLFLVYVPVAHWVFGGGWLSKLGIIDFAGGLVVHTTAGVAALVVAQALGARRGFPKEIKPPHSPGLTMVGAAMLWIGWFGFNAGSAVAANGNAGMAMIATHVAAAAGALAWMAIEWWAHRRPSLVGIVTGMVAGLVAITPGSGFVWPFGALVIGFAAGAACYVAVSFVKRRLKIDDSLDVFAVHGVGGMLGTLLAAVFASSAMGGLGPAAGMTVLGQIGVQLAGIAATALWSAAATFVIVKVVAATVGLRVDAEDETEGLDLSTHGERAYNS